MWRFEDVKMWRFENVKMWRFENMKIDSAPKRQFNGKPDTERSRSVHNNRYLHPSTPLRIQLIGLFGVGSRFEDLEMR